MTATSRAYRAWLARIAAGVFTKAQCQQWCNAVIPLAEGREPKGARTNLTSEEAALLLLSMPDEGVRLTPEHEKQGIAWLRRYGAKRSGIDPAIIEHFDHFTFHGQAELTWSEHVAWLGRQVLQGAAPIWRIHTTDGRTVDYHAAPWQARAY